MAPFILASPKICTAYNKRHTARRVLCSPAFCWINFSSQRQGANGFRADWACQPQLCARLPGCCGSGSTCPARGSRCACPAWWWPCPGNPADSISLAGKSAWMLGKASLGSARRQCHRWHWIRALELDFLGVSPTSPVHWLCDHV